MAARRTGSLIPFLKPMEGHHAIDGDLADMIYQQSLLLTTALDGLRLNQFDEDADWWRDHVTPVFLLADELEKNARQLHEQIGKPRPPEEEATPRRRR